jgi:hypothetical protein
LKTSRLPKGAIPAAAAILEGVMLNLPKVTAERRNLVLLEHRSPRGFAAINVYPHSPYHCATLRVVYGADSITAWLTQSEARQLGEELIANATFAPDANMMQAAHRLGRDFIGCEEGKLQ